MVFGNAAATPAIYTLSLHDALPIWRRRLQRRPSGVSRRRDRRQPLGGEGANPLGRARQGGRGQALRSEEHTSELQSHSDLVCRLLLEKNKQEMLLEWREYIHGHVVG